MAEIEVGTLTEAEGRAFEVTVREGGAETRHRVTLSDEDWDRLGTGYPSPEDFIRACFRFLLDREPKESILSRFDVADISRYFPEFPEEIRRG